MPGSSAISFLRTLCSLRWLAIGGQAITVLVASSLLGLPLPLEPLWAGVGALAAFVLPGGWAFAAALASLAGYTAAAVFGQPLASSHNTYLLLLWGLGANFLISAGVVLYFSTRLATDMRAQERELALLRERFTRNEGIVALATHAAAMAHELNTPLATMTLLVDEVREELQDDPDQRADIDTLRELLALCRERIRNLAVPTEVDLVRVVGQWRLIRPTIDLRRTGSLPESLRVEPSIAHLLQALLNNAADAGEEAGDPRVDLHLEFLGGALRGEVRDHGRGFDPDHTVLPALFNSDKPGGWVWAWRFRMPRWNN
ncbi:his Kinase A domain protein [Bordetella holmesii ATCC 51541]|nr:his Kinase A domain protein [Bordetella holmesii ATCC 51541]EWM48071.1 his Kinase A domain protein [Bordetella holmesii 35009]